MSQTEQRRLEHRLAELERAALFSVYARFYAPIAILSVALSCMPLFEDVVDGNLTTEYGTLWDMAGRNSGDPAVLGILLMLALVVLLAIATFRVRGFGLPVAIAVHLSVHERRQ